MMEIICLQFAAAKLRTKQAHFNKPPCCSRLLNSRKKQHQQLNTSCDNIQK